MNVDTSSSNTQLAGTVNEITRSLEAQNYFDFSWSYPVTKSITLAGSVNNLLDKDPPLANTGAPFGNGNTYPVVYDTLGRKFVFNLTAKF